MRGAPASELTCVFILWTRPDDASPVGPVAVGQRADCGTGSSVRPKISISHADLGTHFSRAVSPAQRSTRTERDWRGEKLILNRCWRLVRGRFFCCAC